MSLGERALDTYAHAEASGASQIIHHSEEVLDSEGGDPLSLRGTLETIHSVDLAHPNVVQTYKSTQRPITVPCSSASVKCFS